MRIGIIAFSSTGCQLGNRISSFFEGKGDHVSLSRCERGGLESWCRKHFFQKDALIFLSSCGIAVRAIAPLIQSKVTDPAVLVVDEGGNFVISLLSGHLGGANELTEILADFLGAIGVITTATDVRKRFAVDVWAKKKHLFIANPEKIKDISAEILEGQSVLLKSLYPVEGTLPKGLKLAEEPVPKKEFLSRKASALWESPDFPKESIPGKSPAATENAAPPENSISRGNAPLPEKRLHILVSHETDNSGKTLHLIPPVLSLGVGCRKNTPLSSIEQAFSLILEQTGCHPAAVSQVCTIDLKSSEPGLLEFCRIRKLPFRTFTSGELNALPGDFTGSDFVKSITGVDNVCERSALLGSSLDFGDGKSQAAPHLHYKWGRLIAGKTALNGVTMALALKPYILKMEVEAK